MPTDPPDPRSRTRRLALLAAPLPGLLAGAHLAALLFFLNPHIELGPGLLLRGTLVYGPVVAAVSLAIVAPLAWARPRVVLRGLPWMTAAVLWAFAALDAAHASRFAFYLPGGINVRLIKAALWLTLAGLIVFYTALLHGLQRPYGLRSRALLWLMAGLSLYAMVERREAFRPAVEGPLPTAVAGGPRLEVAVIALEAATLDVILPLAEQGVLPFFSELLREGTHARLGTLTPTRPVPAWTTLATGKHPYRHGIVSRWAQPVPRLIARDEEWRLRPVGIGFERWGGLGTPRRPWSVVDRQALPLWETLPRLDIATGMVGWPGATSRSRAGFLVADEVFAGAGATTPPGLAAVARARAGAPPPVGDVDPRDRELAAAALAADAWREEVAAGLVAAHPSTQILLLRLPGLAAVSAAAFGGYEARLLEGSDHPRHERAARLLTAHYRHLDEVLARQWARLDEPRLLAVVSAYGVASPGGWRDLAARWSGNSAAVRGRLGGGADGVLLLRGQGIRRGAFLHQARVEDVTPTLLHAFGLPTARDFDGAVLVGAFDPAALERRPLTFVPSYETLAPGER